MSQAWLNGVFLPEEEGYVPIDTHTISYAHSVFEGIRAYRSHDGKGRIIFRLHDHIERLWFSARNLGLWPLPFTMREFEMACVRVLKENVGDTYIRPLIWRGKGLGVNPLPSPICAAIITRPWGKYLAQGLFNDGVKVFLSGYSRPAPHQLPLGKLSASYAVNGLVKAQAIKRGCAEGLLRSPKVHHLAEGTGMNLVLVLGEDENITLCTPDASSCRLDGITLKTTFELAENLLGYRCIQRPIRAQELFRARGIFFTGTATEITGITSVDGNAVGEIPGYCHPVVKNLKRMYLDLVTGKLPYKREQWLTVVPDLEAPVEVEVPIVVHDAYVHPNKRY